MADAPPSASSHPATWWVISAVRDETRDRRIRAVVEAAARGERAQG